MNQTRNTYTKHQKQLAKRNSIQTTLRQDQATVMPDGGAQDRSVSIGLMSKHIHELSLDPNYTQSIEQLYEQQDQLTPTQKRSIQLAYKDLQESRNLPSDFVESYSQLCSESTQARSKAKKSKDFSLFAPYLAKIIQQTKKYCDYINPNKDPYHILLDQYDEGLTKEKTDKLLLPLVDTIQTIIKKTPRIEKKDIVDYDHDQAVKLYKNLMQDFGFAMDRGTIGVVSHPFQITISPNDIRVNYNHDPLISSIYHFIHELGHGLYEQNIHPQYHYTNLGSGFSSPFGIHESQSHTIENMVAKSDGFVKYLHQKLQSVNAYDRNLDTLKNQVKAITPGALRLQADEVTFGLHIIIRYQIEKQLFDGSLSVEKIPETRTALYQQYLGVTPADDSEGCMQDVHRSEGLFGYFPSYSLGDIYAAQLRDKFRLDHPHHKSDFAKGNFSSYQTRYKKHIRQHGTRYTPDQLIKNTTGKELTNTYYREYLQNKYL